MSIMQKINEDVMSVIEYMSAMAPEISLRLGKQIFTLNLRVDEVEEVEE